jgi:hypothetical protein
MLCKLGNGAIFARDVLGYGVGGIFGNESAGKSKRSVIAASTER